ncbi:hypothetical protein RF11_06096 [Thelohanellus kitauei]|uniref:Uncharacterized protein n=1 Tax=Thelohanellus kitauei TaxID=669202 RepID=A0A0C2IZW1_THEKT|nr:hypothetical protein RF11_06096 [Thelohanellus kitauei]
MRENIELSSPDEKERSRHPRYVSYYISDITNEIIDNEETNTSQHTTNQIQSKIEVLEYEVSILNADIIRIREENRRMRIYLDDTDEEIKEYEKQIHELEEVSHGIVDNDKRKLLVLLDRYIENLNANILHRYNVNMTHNDNIQYITDAETRIQDIKNEISKLKEIKQKENFRNHCKI